MIKAASGSQSSRERLSPSLPWVPLVPPESPFPLPLPTISSPSRAWELYHHEAREDFRCLISRPPPDLPDDFKRRNISQLPNNQCPAGYPNSFRHPVFLSIPDPTQFSFGNHQVAGNPKHRVQPDSSAITRERRTRPSSGALLWDWDPQKGPQGAKKLQNLPF